MTPTECGVVCAARRARTPNTPLAPAAANDLCAAERLPPGGAASCRVMLHAWRRRADPPLLPVRTVRTSRTNNAELRAGTGGAPGRGSGGSRDLHSIAGDPDRAGSTIAGTHDCRRPRAAAAAGAGRPDRAGPPNAAEVRGRTATEATPGTRTARGTAPSNFRGRDDAAGTHRNYTTRINLLYSNVQLRTAQCTSRSPIQASSPDS